MKIFLDTRDLIDLLEGRGPCDLDELRGRLERGGHELAVSPTVVFELAAPLIHPRSTTVVTLLLNRLQTLPLAFLADGQVSPRELKSAIAAHACSEEYVPIDPYVGRFDAAIQSDTSQAPTAGYLNHGLAETVFTIWQERPSVFSWSTEFVRRLQAVLAADRAMPLPPRLDHHFREVFRRRLHTEEIADPPSVDDVADWVYETPNRCPGIRLAYEVFHHLRRNTGDSASASDFADFAHVYCVPYVDLITLDRRMAGYVRQASRGWRDALSIKLRDDLGGLIGEL